MAIDGRIGWTTFRKGAIFLDFPHSTLLIANDLNSLSQEAGFCLNGFIKVPFEIQKWGIIIAAETDWGIQKFLLDTGSTCSIMKPSFFSDEKRHKLHFKTEKFKIENSDFGNWKFWLFEYGHEMEFDGILGVDFFKQHEIYLDFPNQMSYIKPFLLKR